MRMFHLCVVLSFVSIASSTAVSPYESLAQSAPGNQPLNMGMEPASLLQSKSTTSPEFVSTDGAVANTFMQTSSQVVEPTIPGHVLASASSEAAEARFKEATEGAGEANTLKTALDEINKDIVTKSNQVMEEKKWVKQVNEITDQYMKKVKRVQANIGMTRSDIKKLFLKKRQIQNLILQQQLDGKLKDAQSDLDTLTGALSNVRNKADAFERNKKAVSNTVSVIQDQLKRLRGESGDE